MNVFVIAVEQFTFGGYIIHTMERRTIPVRSPLSLIQEDLWPDSWLILVACMMLNCTSRKQVEKVLPKFIDAWSTPDALLLASHDDIVRVISSLGFGHRRAQALVRMTKAYIDGFDDVRSLPGVGEYAARAYEIFCQNTLGSTIPSDGALGRYWSWRTKNEKTKNLQTQ